MSWDERPQGRQAAVPTAPTGVPSGHPSSVSSKDGSSCHPTAGPQRPVTSSEPQRPGSVSRDPLARINPVTRLAGALVMSFPLLVTLDWVSAAVAIGLETVIWLALSPRHVFPRLRRLVSRMIPLFIAAPLAGATMLLYGKPGGAIWWHWGFVTISERSVAYGIAIALRVVALGLACIATCDGVDPTDMADGLAQVWKLPARFVLGTLAGVRLISALTRDWKSMELARRARGLGDTRAVRRFVTLGFALLVSAIRRGSALATAMEARGFCSGKRTWARPSTIGWRDWVFLLVAALIMVVALASAALSGRFHWIGS